MTDVSPAGAPPEGTGSRRLKIALIASLALNLLIVGALAGSMFLHAFGKHPPRFGHARGQDFGLMGLTRHLPEERRKEIRKQLRDDRDKVRPLMEEIRTARRAAADSLAADPFDRAALEAAIATVAEKERAMRDAVSQTFLGHAERLSTSERRMLADWWRKKSEPPRHRMKDKDKDKDDAKSD